MYNIAKPSSSRQNYLHEYYSHHGHQSSAYPYHTPGDDRPHTYQYRHHHRDGQVAFSPHDSVQTNLDSSFTLKKRNLKEQEAISNVSSKNSEELTELEELGKEM